MDNRFKYHRSFLIFTHEDSRNGEGREPSGYVKIEIRDGRGKLCCQVSNLRESNDAVYKLYLIMWMKRDLRRLARESLIWRKEKVN